MQSVILGLGTNQGDRIKNLREAIKQIDVLDTVLVKKKSAVFQTPALLKPNSPEEWNIDYFNCCILIETDLVPNQLLRELKKIEEHLGRKLQAERWSPRVIDIDIISWGEEVINEPSLQIPHIGLLERNFVLQPLLQVDPYWVHPKHANFNLHVHLKKLPTLPYAPYQLDQPMIMGILNLSQDSFSGDGIKDIHQIESQFINLVNQGAEVIDIGAVSTKPNAQKVSADEEWQSLKPICDRLHHLKSHPDLMTVPQVSIDTYRTEIVERLQDYPIDIINDVYGVNSQQIANILKQSDMKYCLMHNTGKAGKKYLEINIPAIDQLLNYFEDKKKALLDYGLKQDQLIFDVGIGFGKFPFQVKNILNNLDQLKSLKVELLVGHSRKASISESTNTLLPKERDFETAVISNKIKDKVDYLRVHNVSLSRRAILVF
ncbi:dihydropteroate synthase [Francisellaceae bacterium]|nr:dihydropteroate synthase [Francisellaceae bacterium]